VPWPSAGTCSPLRNVTYRNCSAIPRSFTLIPSLASDNIRSRVLGDRIDLLRDQAARRNVESSRMVSLVPVLSWVVALVAAAVAVIRGPRPVTAPFVIERLLRYIFIFPVGVMGLWAALGHLAVPMRVAQSIGWQTSPFQFEVGAANLGIGLAGFYAAFRSFEARLATNLALAGFLIGAGIGHIRGIIEAGNFAPGNAGPILFTDLLTPSIIFVLLRLARRDGEERRDEPRRRSARRAG
jgi:Family of unknown function (DUF6790)